MLNSLAGLDELFMCRSSLSDHVHFHPKISLAPEPCTLPPEFFVHQPSLQVAFIDVFLVGFQGRDERRLMILVVCSLSSHNPHSTLRPHHLFRIWDQISLHTTHRSQAKEPTDSLATPLR